jgi:predicted PurR-regulated permease PerM
MEDRFQETARRISVLLLLILSFWILKTFLTSIAWATVIAIATWPVFQILERCLPVGLRRTLAPLICTALVAFLLLGPLAYAGTEIAQEVQGMARWMVEVQKKGWPAPAWIEHIPWIGPWISVRWNTVLGVPGSILEHLRDLDPGLILRWTRLVGLEVLRRMAVLGVTVLVLFFLYRDGATLARAANVAGKRLLGTPGERYMEHSVTAVRSIVNGLLLVSLGEGILFGIAYSWLHVPHPVLLSGLTAFLGMIPFAAPIVFGGVSLYLLAQARSLAALALLIYGGVILFAADHFVRPALISGTARMPFLLVFLGILGGLEAFGLLGLFLGPTVLAALLAAWREFVSEP